jgi:hypothetical protein
VDSERVTAAPTLRETVRLYWPLIHLSRAFWSDVRNASALGIIIGLVALPLLFLTKTLIDQAYPANDVDLIMLVVVGALTLSVTESTACFPLAKDPSKTPV